MFFNGVGKEQEVDKISSHCDIKYIKTTGAHETSNFIYYIKLFLLV